jgi:hypothetical protein
MYIDVQVENLYKKLVQKCTKLHARDLLATRYKTHPCISSIELLRGNALAQNSAMTDYNNSAIGINANTNATTKGSNTDGRGWEKEEVPGHDKDSEDDSNDKETDKAKRAEDTIFYVARDI